MSNDSTTPKGWNLTTVRPNPTGGPPLKGMILAAIADPAGAILAAQSRFPDAQVTIDSEASAESIEKYLVKKGQVFVLVEAS